MMHSTIPSSRASSITPLRNACSKPQESYQNPNVSHWQTSGKGWRQLVRKVLHLSSKKSEPEARVRQWVLWVNQCHPLQSRKSKHNSVRQGHHRVCVTENATAVISWRFDPSPSSLICLSSEYPDQMRQYRLQKSASSYAWMRERRTTSSAAIYAYSRDLRMALSWAMREAYISAWIWERRRAYSLAMSCAQTRERASAASLVALSAQSQASILDRRSASSFSTRQAAISASICDLLSYSSFAACWAQSQAYRAAFLSAANFSALLAQISAWISARRLTSCLAAFSAAISAQSLALFSAAAFSSYWSWISASILDLLSAFSLTDPSSLNSCSRRSRRSLAVSLTISASTLLRLSLSSFSTFSAQASAYNLDLLRASSVAAREAASSAYILDLLSEFSASRAARQLRQWWAT